MHDLDTLRRLGDELTPPPFDSLVTVARKRDRRGTAVLGAALAAVVMVGGGIVLAGDDERSAPAVDDPTPAPSEPADPKPKEDLPSPRPGSTRLSPEQIVNAPNAVLVGTGFSLDDPDFRVSMWDAECFVCEEHLDPAVQKELRGHSRTFAAMAVSTDGFRTATNLPRPVGPGISLDVLSPAPGVLLLNDSSNGREWLLQEDGSMTRVQRVDTPIQPANERLWFECYPEDDSLDFPNADGGGGGILYTRWCSLDVATATAYEWPLQQTEAGVSEPRPGSAVAPWGTSVPRDGPEDRVAWWDDDGTIQRRPLTGAEYIPHGKIDEAPGPAYWLMEAPQTVRLLLVSDDRDTSRWVSRPAPPLPRGYTGSGGRPMVQYADLQIAVTPDDAVLAWTTWPRRVVWRADSLTGGDFDLVYDSGERDQPQTDVTFFDGKVFFGTVTSDDDGRTWTPLGSWR